MTLNQAPLQLLDVVALLDSLPAQNLASGQVGTIVELLAPGIYEVEFSDDEGQTYALLPLHGKQLLQLHHKPSHSALNNPNDTFGHANLLQVALTIKDFLDRFSQDHDTHTPIGQMIVATKTIEAIEHNPTLKTRVINALQSAGDTALEGAIGHSIAKIVIAAAKGFLQP
jgi:hypothetical protein